MLEKIEQRILELKQLGNNTMPSGARLFILGQIQELIWVKNLLIEDDTNKVI